MSVAMDPRQRAAYELAVREIGTKEIPGPRHNPSVVQYFADVGEDWVKDDETAWCGAFAGSTLVRSGLPAVEGPLGAQNWHKKGWGVDVPIDDAQPGDLIVLRRGPPGTWKGHVAYLHRVIRQGGTGKVIGFELVGGNQSNSVNAQYYDRFDQYGDKLLGVRRWPSERKPGVVSPEAAQKATPYGVIIAIVLAAIALIFGG